MNIFLNYIFICLKDHKWSIIVWIVIMFFGIFFISCNIYIFKVWHKSIMLLHVQSIQTLRVNNLCFLFKCLFFTKCPPFLLKIKEDFNIDDYEGKRAWIDEVFFKTHLNTFGSKSVLKIMDFENVPWIKVVHVYMIESMIA